MDQYIGKLLDNRYEILERIGSGGMAMVYKARCHRLNRLVAIKILKEELAQDADFRRRFHDESQAVAMLSHPNIVAVYDVSKSPDIDYIVMELIDGITLKQYMHKRGGKLSWREALHFITQIMKGLSHAHSRGIIHRDIKPHNIMVLRDGSIKVADFGIARLASAAQNTLTQEALGSVHYISPEQAKGSHIDARSDIYSAGVVLYEMITGRLPYEGDSPVAVAIQHINSVPLSPREIDPEIPEALEAITMRAMASDVGRRYISADAMLCDLEEFRKNPSINFDYSIADLTGSDGDEPTQVLGANTPSGVHSIPVHMPREDTGSGRRRYQPPQDPRDEDYDDLEPSRRGGGRVNWSVITAVGVVLLFLVGVGFVLWLTLFSNILGGQDPTYAVPSVTGMTLAEAREIAQNGGFTIEEGETIHHDTVPEGQIISQSPEADTSVKAGERIITVIISGGQEAKPTMPAVEGGNIDLAKRILTALELDLNIVEEPEAHETVEKDNIISQAPVAGSELTRGQTVTLRVSTGPQSKKVTVILFEGMQLNEALSKLGTGAEQVDLKQELKEEYSETIEQGRIIRQSIPVGTEVDAGTKITLTYSKGPDPAVAETPEPSPTPENTPPVQSAQPTQPQTPVTKPIDITLPDDGRETVFVSIVVGGVTVMDNEEFQTNLGTIRPSIMSTGKQEVIVYIDGAESFRVMMDFS